MVFASLPFLLVFLPICTVFYLCAKTTEKRNRVLLVFSLIFYAWGEPVYVLLLLFMSLADWFFALCIEKYYSQKKLFMILTCIVNLGLIGVFKYGSFIMSNIYSITGSDKTAPNIILPIGISFYTFQLLSYVIDVYRGQVKAQKRYFIVLLYASLFHQCIAGPIVRYADIEEQLFNRKVNIYKVHEGINRFCVGLVKKAVLANTCGKLFETFVVADNKIGTADAVDLVAGKPVLSLWLGIFMFSMQIYLDFSAYSDMAIGMGKMIGLEYKENFNYPYLSHSVSEFWRRWHISLGSFFRDYVYIPLGGNRKGQGRTIFNMFIVWALTGLWHGASWNYLLWGLYFFVFLVIEKLFLADKLKNRSVLSHLYFFIVIYFGWVIFKFENFRVLGTVLKGMFGLNHNGFTDFETGTAFKANVLIIIVCMIACTPLVKNICEKIRFKNKNDSTFSLPYRIGSVVMPVAALILSLISLVGDTYNPFLYFQF